MTDTAGSRKRRLLWIGAGAGLLAIVLGGIAVWYFVFRDTAPPAVDVDRAAESVTTDTGSGRTGVDGTWKIDDQIGDVNVDTGTFTGTFVGYRVNEQLAGIGAKTAFGRTPDVTGSLTIGGTTATAAAFEANLATLHSDEPGRDDQIHQQAIETSRFPKATFTLTQPIAFATVPGEGQTIKVDATGTLTLHGVTKTVTFPLEAKRVGDAIVVTGQLDLRFADYGVAKPTSFKVLSIDDHGILEVQLFFRR